MTSIIIPLYYSDRYAAQLDFTLNYYNNLGVLHEVIVIDDCSPSQPVFGKYQNIKFAKIKTDIQWNQPGARNLGAHLSKGDMLVFVDVDHLLPPLFELFEDCVTLFPRLSAGKQIPPNQGIVGIPRDLFVGYDEDFCGHYGKDDKWFLRTHGYARTAHSPIVCLNSRTNDLTRDSSYNQKLFDEKTSLLKSCEYKMGEKLRFEWELI